MASLIDNLITTLNTENDEYAALFDLSMEKTGIIVKGDVDALNNIVEREQEVIERIIVLEKKREECTKDIATVLNKDYRRLTLPLLIEYLKGQEREARLLSEVHGRLKSTMSQMVQINEQNKVLLQESLDMVEFEMNILRGMKQAPSTANYSGSEYADNNYGAMGSFDAKQ